LWNKYRIFKTEKFLLKPVILTYFGDGDQEDQSLRPAQANGSRDPISTHGWDWWYAGKHKEGGCSPD
jgi:hypothetical protein